MGWSEWFKVQSFISWGFPWLVGILEHIEELAWLDNSSSWIDLEARFEIPWTMEVCMGCDIETRSGSLVLGDIVIVVVIRTL
jgi:hypothetical protein